MRPGDILNPTIFRQTAGGDATRGLALADFTIGAYADGAPVTISPAIVEGTPFGAQPNRRTPYKLTFTLPSYKEWFTLAVMPASGSDIIIDGEMGSHITSNDADSLAAAQLLQGSVPVSSASPTSLGDIVDGDTWSSLIGSPAHLLVPSAKLAVFNQATLAGLTIEAAISNNPGVGGVSYPIVAAVFDATALTFDLSWAGGSSQPHPPLAAGSVNPVVWNIDVQFIKAGSPNQIVTTNRYTFNQVPQYDPRIT